MERQLEAVLGVIEVELETFWETETFINHQKALRLAGHAVDEQEHADDIRAGYDWLKANLPDILAHFNGETI